MKKLMLKSVLLAIPGILLLALSCNKQVSCTGNIEIKGRQMTDANYNVDPGVIAGVPEFVNLLKQYPQLEPLRTIADSTDPIMYCRVFYNELIVFTDYVSIVKHKRENTVSVTGDIPAPIAISLSPKLSYTDAITIAKDHQYFGDDCIAYRLGIYDLHVSDGTELKDYRLVWNITGSGGEYPLVVVDAQDGNVYRSFDGIEE